MRKILFRLMMPVLGILLGTAGIANKAEAAVPLYASLQAASATAPYNGPRHKFARPSANPHEIAERIRASLRVNSRGQAPIDGPGCALACATPEDYLEMLHASSDFRDVAPVSVDKLADFYDHLELIARAPEGEYFMACKSGNGSADAAPVWDCMTRKFHAGEPCYAFNGKCVLARDCTNPVGRRKEINDCVRQLVYMHRGDVLRAAPLAPADAGPMPVNAKCPMMVREPGSDESAHPPRDDCPRAGCDFSAPAAFLHMKVLEPRFSFQAKTDGWAIIYLPVEITRWNGVMEYCIEPVGGPLMAGKDIHRYAYHNNDAYLVFSSRQTPADWHGVPHVWVPNSEADYNANR